MTEHAVESNPVDLSTPPEPPRALPSGRSVTIRASAAGEQVEVRSPDGEVEVTIELTPQGPLVRLRGARLELAASEVRVDCDRFSVEARHSTEIRTEGDVHIAAGGELRVQTEQDTHINGKMIYLNS